MLLRLMHRMISEKLKKKNADIAGENDGVTNADALAIQKKLLKLD